MKNANENTTGKTKIAVSDAEMLIRKGAPQDGLSNVASYVAALTSFAKSIEAELEEARR